MQEYYAAHPSFAAFQGLHQFDGQLPDWSAKGLAREIARLKQWRQRLQALSPRIEQATLSANEFERRYLLAKINHDLFWLDDAQWPQRNPDFYFNWLLGDIDFDLYLSRPYAPLDQRLQAWLHYAENLPIALRQIASNLTKASPQTRTYGAERFTAMADFIAQSLPSLFAPVLTAATTTQFAQRNQTAEAALRQLAAGLSSPRRDDEMHPFALGPPLLQRMVKATEGIDLSIAEINALGEQELARHQAQLRAACAQFAPRATVAECMYRNSDDKPAEGQVAAAQQQLISLRQFVEQQALVSIPGHEQAQVKIAPAYAVGGGAYIQMPGPYDKDLPAVYYIAPADPTWTTKEQHDYLIGRAELLYTSAHEVWPGHFLHGMHSNRAASEPQRVFASYAFTEGWAHYAEEMIDEAGFGGSEPSWQIGQLSNALLRDARLLTAIGLHSGTMTVQQAEQFFIERAYQNTALAREEAKRAVLEPTVLNYALGRILIRQLRARWCQQKTPCSWRDFHDRLLSLGAPPLPLAQQMLIAP